MRSRQGLLRRSGMRSIGLGLILAVLAGAAAGCGGSSGGPSSSASQTLWVPNFQGDFLSVFTGKTLKKSGTPVPAGVNLSSALNEPFGEVFDSSKNLWVSNVGEDLGTLTLFTFAQLKALGTTNNPYSVRGYLGVCTAGRDSLRRGWQPVGRR